MYWSIPLPEHITISKNKSLCYFFRALYHTKNVIPHPVIAAILEVILNILQRWKQHQQQASQILQIQLLIKLSENSYWVQFWFQVEFRFKMVAIFGTILNMPTSCIKPMLHFNRWYY